MANRREYEIAFVGLKPGEHDFYYRITDKFFEAYQQQDFQHCDANVKLTLDKKIGFLMLKFEVGGKIDIGCDRCGNMLPVDLWDEFNIVVKFAEDPQQMNEQEEDPDVYYIARGESHIDVADWIYEFINLSIPFQRMCREDEIGGPQCNKEVLETLRKLSGEVVTPQKQLWKGLEKFKDLDN